MTFEDNMAHYARIMNQPTVILCDRGLMDGSAYIDVDGWSQLMAEVGLDPISARDSRYDAVFHLVTAADGAEAFYTLEVLIYISISLNCDSQSCHCRTTRQEVKA